MNKTANYIKNRLSLREPQADSLEILSILADKIPLKKNNNIEQILQSVRTPIQLVQILKETFPQYAFRLQRV